MIATHVSRPMRSASASGPIGCANPSFAIVSIASGSATPSCSACTASLMNGIRVRIGAALLRQPLEALAHRRQPALGGARKRIVDRHASSRHGDDLRNAAAHLPRADDQDVLELAHGEEANA